ncbi:kinase-like domain-containing protein [Suillus subluteus]|nr:kinase-like domain-containing protein [Suillus subluteus]
MVICPPSWPSLAPPWFFFSPPPSWSLPDPSLVSPWPSSSLVPLWPLPGPLPPWPLPGPPPSLSFPGPPWPFLMVSPLSGLGVPHALWFGRESTYHALVLGLLGPSLHDLFLAHDRKFSLHTVVNLGIQLISRLEYIHSHNYVHCDIKPQNILVGLGHLKHTAFIIDFSIAKEYWDTATRVHIPFRQNQRLTGTPAFASINNHLGVDLGRHDDLESLTYMLIYLLRGSLPWLTSDHEKLSSTSILERKVNTTIEVLCNGIPVEFASVLIYTRSLAFSEDPDYGHLRSLLCGLQATLAAPSTSSLDFSKPDDHIIHHLLRTRMVLTYSYSIRVIG